MNSKVLSMFFAFRVTAQHTIQHCAKKVTYDLVTEGLRSEGTP